MLAAASVACIASGLACGGTSSTPNPLPPTPLDPLVVESGDVHAELDPSTGGLSVRAPWNPTLLASPKGRALVAVKLDPDDPDGWHDPETAGDAEFVEVRELRRDADGALTGALPGGGSVRLLLSRVTAPATPPPHLPDHLAIEVTTAGAPVVLIALRLGADDGAYVGFGERFEHVDARGALVPLSFRLGNHRSGTNEAHVAIPRFVSSKGYGLSFDTGEAGAADVGHDDPRVVRVVFEGRSLRAQLLARRDPLDVVAGLGSDAAPRVPPLWSFAPMQWRNEGVDDAKVLDDVTTTRARKIPGGCLWIDNPWQASYDDATFDPKAFADPKQLLDRVRGLGFEVMVWSTPYLEFDRSGTPANRAQKWFDEARDKGFLIRNGGGKVFDSPTDVAKPVPVAMLDLVDDGARAWWTEKMTGATALGVAGFKLDFAEDLLPEFLGRRLDLVVGGKPGRETRSRYPLAYHRAYRDAVPVDGRGAFILGRASALGGQAEVDAIWPGDLDDDFRRASDVEVGGLPASISAMITLAASGFPTYAADTGGFRGGEPTKEALLRWAEANAMSIVFQNGGGGTSHNPWRYDEETVSIFRAIARRHMDLVPYLRALSLRAHADGTPTVRALPLQFPDEVAAIGAHADDEYMLGPDLLVAPVIEPGVDAREVYLPSGAWVRWSRADRVIGPQRVTMPAPLGDTIVLVREGAVLPLLAADVDTLGTATDPGVVTGAMRASVFRAHAVPFGKGHAAFEDGTTVDVDGDATSVVFTPHPADGTLTLTLDFQRRDAAPAKWSLDGAPVAEVGSADAATSCAASCAFVDAGSRRVTLHLAHGGSASGS